MKHFFANGLVELLKNQEFRNAQKFECTSAEWNWSKRLSVSEEKTQYCTKNPLSLRIGSSQPVAVSLEILCKRTKFHMVWKEKAWKSAVKSLEIGWHSKKSSSQIFSFLFFFFQTPWRIRLLGSQNLKNNLQKYFYLRQKKHSIISHFVFFAEDITI